MKSLNKNTIDSKELSRFEQLSDKIIQNLKQYYKVLTDTDLAKRLGIEVGVITMWRIKKTVNLKTIINADPELSIDYLITGLPPLTLTDRMPSGDGLKKNLEMEQFYLNKIDFLVGELMVVKEKVCDYNTNKDNCQNTNK